ncbi:MAG: hypothetical protein N2316_08680 [Spirochaetes bacterium]|nr:hypothetical protein [Spirochaetota bacterium]
MVRDYFVSLGGELIKACNASQKEKSDSKASKGKKKATSCEYHPEKVREILSKFIPNHFTVGTDKVINSAGYSPQGVDFIVYKKIFPNMDLMMQAIPCELVYGAFFIIKILTATSLAETLMRVANLKKIHSFSEDQTAQFIPAFILAMDLQMTYQDLKNLILDFYVSRSLDNLFEFDIMAIVNQGIVVKDWREKRSFKILDTGDDTMQWFFILMNEYLDVKKDELFDLRRYVKETRHYREY